MSQITINMEASVVEYSLTREILFKLGYGAAVENDGLKVYAERNSYSLYVDPKSEGAKVIASLYIDEGVFSYCLTRDGLEQYNHPWMEFCDFRAVLSLIVLKYSPDFKPAPSKYIGRGRTQSHYISEYHNEVLRMEREEPDSEMFKLFKFE